MKKKEKKKKIILLILILVLAAIILTTILININKSPREKKSIKDFKNIKEIIEYYNCTYISTKKSEEEGFEKDIRINFSINPITEEGISNKYIYNNILGAISAKLNNQNFRVIDENKKIIVRVYTLESGKTTYTINGDADYFQHAISKMSIENELVEDITQIKIDSNILNQIINNNWKTINLSLGTVDSTMDKYDIYFDEGYKIRKINGKIYNIIFTNKYSETVINNLKTNNTIEEIQAILGKPSYSTELENSEKIIGYKTENLYIFFNEKEISIYPNQEIENQDEFSSLVSNFIEKKDIQEFLSKLTDIWPDYSDYNIDQSFITIKYPLKGISIEFNNSSISAIKVYNNYKGKITNEITIEDIKENKILPTYINVELNQNLVNIAEIERTATDSRKRFPWDKEETIKTEKYVVYLTENRCEFYSTDRQNIDSYLSIVGLNNIFMINEETFVYSIKGQGIYTYNATNKVINKIIEGNDNFEIKGIEQNIINYDNTQITINI